MSTRGFSPRPRRQVLLALGVVLALLTTSGGATRAATAHDGVGPPWFTAGNGGTNPSANFLGTIDNQPLVIRTNNTEALRVTVGGSVGIGTSNPIAKLTVNGGMQAAGTVNAVGGVQENGVPLSSKYLLLNGGNYTSPAPATGQVLLFNGTGWAPDSTVTTLQSQVSQLQTRLTADESTLSQLQGLLGGVSLSADGTTLTIAGHGSDANAKLTTVLFKGVNVQVVNGTGQEYQLNGLGNLIVGYADNAHNYDRGGSHNLITGDNGGWSSYGGLLAGNSNRITGKLAAVSGGEDSTASGDSAAVSGGHGNTASGPGASISGGTGNTASGTNDTILGGYLNSIAGSVNCGYFPDSATTSNC